MTWILFREFLQGTSLPRSGPRRWHAVYWHKEGRYRTFCGRESPEFRLDHAPVSDALVPKNRCRCCRHRVARPWIGAGELPGEVSKLLGVMR